MTSTFGGTFAQLRRANGHLEGLRQDVASLSRAMGVHTDALDTAATPGHVRGAIAQLERAHVTPSIPTRIHLDVDGVLADWSAAAIRLFDRDPVEVRATWPDGVWDLAKVLGISTTTLWRKVDAAGEDFWAGLELFPWSMDLYDLCQSLAPTTLLTSPSRDPGSMSGKLRWMQRHFGRKFTGYLVGPDKAAAASQWSVLIDDRPGGLAKYAAEGGHGILFPAAQNDRAEHRMNPLTVVEPMLRALFGGAS